MHNSVECSELNQNPTPETKAQRRQASFMNMRNIMEKHLVLQPNKNKGTADF